MPTAQPVDGVGEPLPKAMAALTGDDMSHYKTNLRDIEFNLFEVLGLGAHLTKEPFEDFDSDTVKHILLELERLATEDMAASFADADRNPPKLVDGKVELPASLKKSLDAYYDGGWDMLGVPKDLGGLGAPNMVRWAGQEMLVGANPSAFFFIIGGLMAVVIGEVGTPEQSELWAKRMMERRWGGTMVLTEPDAGSDVGAGTTKAIPVDESKGVYHIEGVKRFITSAASDYHENIVHLVLARRPGAPAGTKGLSMFIVPNFLVNDDGTLGERNGVEVTKIEDKMGIKSSTTCELDVRCHDKPAVGYLVGGSHHGIKQMFHVIEDARMLIGTKSMSTLSTGYLNALEYAKERIQSADMTQMTDKEAPRVAIIRHPDVRRMLMLQKSHAEGMRALMYYTAWALDHGAHRSRRALLGEALRPVAPDAQGLLVREGVRAARPVAPGVRRLRLPARLPDGAVHPRRQDRLAVRGHDRHPVAGPVLPQDRPRPGCNAQQARR